MNVLNNDSIYNFLCCIFIVCMWRSVSTFKHIHPSFAICNYIDFETFPYGISGSSNVRITLIYDIIFHGGVSLQGALRFGNPQEVEQEVKTCCETLGKNGGYIICSADNLNADMKTENIVALFDAYKKYCNFQK